jgi:predicted ribosomally synthesized peptide with nif11-like leader
VPIVKVKEAPMKTLAEFIQRLHDDAAFEKQAQAFDHADDLIAFVKREGYDFTLEQLMSEFEPGEKLPADVSTSPPPRPDETEFPREPETLSSGESGTSILERRKDVFIIEPPLERLQQPKAPMPPPEPEKVPLAELFKGGGGRHRGFSPQRLKSLSDEEP